MCDDSASAPIGEEKKEVVLRVKKISTLPLPTHRLLRKEALRSSSLRRNEPGLIHACCNKHLKRPSVVCYNRDRLVHRWVPSNKRCLMYSRILSHLKKSRKRREAALLLFYLAAWKKEMNKSFAWAAAAPKCDQKKTWKPEDSVYRYSQALRYR